MCSGLRKRYQARLEAGDVGVMNTFWRVVWIVARKDLAIEARSRELLNTTLFFALSCVIVFAVSFVREGPLGDAAAGILWVAIAFSGTLALGRTFERERYGDTLRALLLAPGARPAIYVGKLVGVVALLIATEIVVVPLVALLFQASLFAHPVLMSGLLLFGTIGFASVGTLFAAMLARARSSRCAAADSVVSGDHPGHDRGSSRDRCAAGRCARARHGSALDHAAGFV